MRRLKIRDCFGMVGKILPRTAWVLKADTARTQDGPAALKPGSGLASQSLPVIATEERVRVESTHKRSFNDVQVSG